MSFEFESITNLKDPSDYHSRQMVVKIEDGDHIRIQYFGMQAGERMGQAYDLRRVE